MTDTPLDAAYEAALRDLAEAFDTLRRVAPTTPDPAPLTDSLRTLRGARTDEAWLAEVLPELEALPGALQTGLVEAEVARVLAETGAALGALATTLRPPS